MNLTPELLALQGCLVSADRSAPFARLAARGGNEENISTVVKILQKYLKEKRYLSNEEVTEKNKSQMRKFCLYLILNSDFSALEELVELPNISHIIWTVPTISKCLLSEIVWGLNMEEYIGEVISHCNPKLTVQILKALVNSIRYLNPQDSVEKVFLLSVASYRSICRLIFFNYDNSVMSTILTDFFDSFLRCITSFVSPPNNGKLELLETFDKYVHLGKAFKSLLKCTLICLDEFESPVVFNPDGTDDLYFLTIDTNLIKEKLPQRFCESEENIKDFLQKCNVAMLDKCVELVMRVSVDVFCCWSEFEEKEVSLQRGIGELCYKLNAKLQLMKHLSEHTLLNMLPQLSSKPTDIFDLIKKADEDMIIKNVEKDNNDKEHWLNAIIERTNLYSSDKLMTCLRNNLEHIKEDVCESIFRDTLKHLQQNTYDNEGAKLLTVDSFIRVSASKKSALIHETVFPDKIYHNLLQTTNFDHDVTGIFNKLISSEDATLSDIYALFIQNPRAVLNVILSTGIENLKQADTMLKVSTMLGPLAKYHYSEEKESTSLKSIEQLCLTKLDTEVKQNSFLRLISGLKCEEIISGDRLFHVIVMPNMHKAAVNGDLTALRLHITLLKQTYRVEELLQHRAPLLAMLANFMDILRWNLSTYLAEAPETLQKVIELQTTIFNSYGPIIPVRESSWLKTKLQKQKPMNMYYFRNLWDPPGDNFIEIITKANKVELDKYDILLSTVLFSCTPEEWMLSWESAIMDTDRISALGLMKSALTMISIVESQKRSNASYMCIKYSFRNFVTTVKELYLSEEQNGEYVEHVLEATVHLAGTIGDDIAELGTILLPLVAILAEKKQHLKPTIIEKCLGNIKHCKFSSMVQSIFDQAVGVP